MIIKNQNEKTGEQTSVYERYPGSIVLLFNGTTMFYYLLGGFGIMLGYNFSWVGNILGYLYFIFSFGQMYLILPFFVCRNCIYVHRDESRCMSGLNVLSRRFAKPGNQRNFIERKQGLFCSNNLNVVSLFIPVIILIHALVFNFSLLLLLIFLLLIDLLALRYLVILPKLICKCCLARQVCPIACTDSATDADRSME